jgi:2-polyprenyl-6-methoxyphenol hydroxylase-like FAD-dependent oxidoreductase
VLQVAVIGASLAGLFGAAAVSRAGHRVTVLERDRLDDTAAARPGVPHGAQPHVFLLRGLLAAEELLPGLRRDLQALGAVPFDSARLAWLGEQGWVPAEASGFEIISQSRPLLEQVVLRRVRELDGVRLRDNCRVSGLRRNSSPGRPRWRVEVEEGDGVDADVVIDASGRGSRLPTWLASLGVSAPAVTEVDARIGYATREYRGDPDLGGLSGIVLQATADSPVGGLVLPVENQRWLVLATGMGEHRPPRDVPGFEAHLRRLTDPSVADFADSCTPCGDVQVYRRTGNRRYHFERQRDWPAGLLAIGDSFVSFNPVFAQGITVAAVEALVLRDALTEGRLPDDARRVMRRFAAVTALPWGIATGQDLRQPTSSGRQTRAQAVMNAWARELSRLAAHGDARAMEVLTRMYHLMGTPRSLLHPALVGSALRARVRGDGPAAGRPAALAGLTGARHPDGQR